MEPITLVPIGYVECDLAETASAEERRAHESCIVLDEALTEGLLGLEPGDDLVVLYYCHQVTDYELQHHPWGDPERPLKGVFATRTQHRPNPIALTVVRLLAIEGNVLRVLGLDALDGSPVLDLKSFASPFDLPPPAAPPSV